MSETEGTLRMDATTNGDTALATADAAFLARCERILDGAWYRDRLRRRLWRRFCGRFGHGYPIAGKVRLSSSDPVITVCSRCLALLDACPGEPSDA